MTSSVKNTDPMPFSQKRSEGSTFFNEGRSIDLSEHASMRASNVADIAQDAMSPLRMSSLLRGSLYRTRKHEKSNSASPLCVDEDVNEWTVLGQEATSEIFPNRTVIGKHFDIVCTVTFFVQLFMCQ